MTGSSGRPEPPDGVRAAIHAALHDQASPHDQAGDVVGRLCQVCIELVAVDGASVSVMTDESNREVVYASDEVIAHVETVQFSLGEGPCFEAFQTRRPVLVPDLAEAATPAWPLFAAELAGWPVGAIFAFPLQTGAVRIGAMDLYRRRPGWLSTEQIAIALHAVDVATTVLLGAQAGFPDGSVDGWAEFPLRREQVHQATGMVMAALRIPAGQALAQLRGYAFAAGRVVDEVADDVVARRLSPFDLDG
ncbi:GAF and ANTAR domain-containing protein [Actinophytocola sp.]|uniref:GAF and ANTAR domain-containing protein n=1 Tax=Actinophytocola sp. TaxID=1872138 RepID=UPI002D7EBBC4|nr:GAF and ANTAR domain-containing protein [Actinophytocola sp.]HET9139175.1 GAF and ANTAR domain-containing protein [Actinophytocola sp.]